MALLACGEAGCKKSDSPEQGGKSLPDTPVSSSSNVIQVHWLGKKRVSSDINSSGFMKIWNLPESARLESQTLDKIALGLANQLPITNAPTTITNYKSFLGGASALLRPLLDDVVQEECYFEMRKPSAQSSAFVLAMRLNAKSAALWETNLASALQVLTGVRPTPTDKAPGWQIQFSDSHPIFKMARMFSKSPAPLPTSIQLNRAGDWTLVGVVQEMNGAKRNKTESPSLLAEIQRRISSGGNVPFNTSSTNFWIEGEADLAVLLPPVLRTTNPPPNLPRVAITVIGDGDNVRTRGHFDFPQPVAYREEKWNIPTNLMSAPLVSFTAIRGIAPLLESLESWKKLQIGPPANQLYLWALAGPIQTFLAAPHPDASNQVSKITALVLDTATNLFATNDIVAFKRSDAFNGLEWKGLPVISPFLKSQKESGGDFCFAGLIPESGPSIPPGPELTHQIFQPSDLVCYDWELTGPRVEQWRYMAQFFRFALFRKQMIGESASFGWFKAAINMLGNCGTTVSLSGPNKLSFTRRSTVGFSAFELHLLADWLESPTFPSGLHSFLAAPPALSEEYEPPPPKR